MHALAKQGLKKGEGSFLVVVEGVVVSPKELHTLLQSLLRVVLQRLELKASLVESLEQNLEEALSEGMDLGIGVVVVEQQQRRE